MPNPIVSMMQRATPNGNNNMLSVINNAKAMLSGNNPQAAVQMLAQQNPQFAKFLNDNANKSPQQIAQENGIDINAIYNLMR